VKDGNNREPFARSGARGNSEMEQRKMNANLRVALRILLMTAVAIFFGHVWPQPVLASPQAAAPQARQHTPASATGADTDQISQSESQAGDQQLLEQMRAQLDREAMERVRDGRGSGGGFERTLDDVGGFFIFLVVAGSLLWIVRVALEHRRWHRMVKVQTETHAKLLDKFGSSQDMLAYMDSEAGRRFLETPVFDAQNKRSMALPYGRILWSAQIGLIAAALGAGFLFLRGKVNPDADVAFLVFGTLMFTLGIGFLVSGGVSYGLAKYMGLLTREESGLSRSAAHSSSS
jgi:hypothetical protein